uniref:Uncharacterized protein n=1 Tax=Macaca nemestrina TaxID=9545 RepID=A0A2K6D4E6_MACNE
MKALGKRMCTKQCKNKMCFLEVRITQAKMELAKAFPPFPASSMPPKTEPFKERPENNWPLMLS